MTPEEDKVFFCGQVTKAASLLGIPIQEYKNENLIHFGFFDPQTKVSIRGAASEDRFTALENSCKTLVKYLNSTD